MWDAFYELKINRKEVRNKYGGLSQMQSNSIMKFQIYKQRTRRRMLSSYFCRIRFAYFRQSIVSTIKVLSISLHSMTE